MSMYQLEITVNNQTVKKRGEDLRALFSKVKPSQVLTESYVTVKNGKNTLERRFDLVQTKKLFSDEETREIFLNTFSSLYPQT